MTQGGAIRSIFVEVGLVDGATAGLSNIDKAADKTKASMAGVAADAQKAQNAQRNVLLGVAAAMAVGSAVGFSYFKEGTASLAKYQDAYAAFKTNVKGNSDELVASLRDASAGLIDEGDMLGQANKALIMGIPEDKLSTLMKTSRALARQTGEDLPTIWTSLTSGAARASPKMLEAIGINMGAVTEAEKAWAKARGISYASLTEEQKNQIFMNYILEHSNDILKKTDFSQESLNETLIRSNRSWAELRQEIAEGALPVIVSVVKATNWFIDIIRALPGPVKGALGIVGVLVTGMLALGSFTIFTALAFMLLKNQMFLATGQATIWGGIQAMLFGETGLLTGAVGLLSMAYDALAGSELAALWPLLPLIGILYLLYDLYSKGWQDSLLGRFFGWLGKTILPLAVGFAALTDGVKTLWDWITMIPNAIAGAWTAVTNHPLFKIMGVLLAGTPIGMAINSAQMINAAAPVVVPTAQQLVASSSSTSHSIRYGDVNTDVKVVAPNSVTEQQARTIAKEVSKEQSKNQERAYQRDFMGSSLTW